MQIAGGGLAAILCLCIVAAVLDLAFPPPIERARIVSTVVTDRAGRPLRAFPVEDGRWRLAARLETIDPALIEALIAVEDKRFRRHAGIDPVAVLRAAASAVRQGKITSGASTLTMQTARLLEPRPRTLGAKGIEMLRALQLERRLSKDEILEIYLTLAPYGGNLEGVRTASWAWFGREPHALSPDQIALLIALPQAPEARRPDRRPEAARAARARILNQLAGRALLSADRARDAAEEAFPTSRRAFPAEAWHASAFVLDDHRDHRQRPDPAVLPTPLDRPLQRFAEALVAEAVRDGSDGLQAAALVVEARTGAVRAAVGSAFRDRAGGWLDLTDRPRSPGSALKPLIYGLGFDDGILAPQTLIDDLPARFATYRPENFDRTFRGEVTIAAALQHSLNVPAVRVLDRVGAERFLAALAFSGSTPTIPERAAPDVGLAVALGGLGLSVRDMAVLYGSLATDGRTRPLVWHAAAAQDHGPGPSAEGYPLLSAESAREVAGILAGSPAPPGRIPARLSAGAPRIAFKTGTSYGYRDAWAAGIGGGHVVVVWIGRPDGAPRAGVTGREAALPLLFDLFDAVDRTLGTQPNSVTPFQDLRTAPPLSQRRFEAKGTPPQILFPPDGAELWAEDERRGFVLSGRGAGSLRWYADEKPVPLDAGGAAVWTPEGPGFFRLVAVDAAGRSTAVRVRVRVTLSEG